MISKKCNLLKPFLDEKSRCLFAASEALSIVKSNISIVSRTAVISEYTIKKGCSELENGKVGTSETPIPDNKLRAPGGGRKKSVEKDPTLLSALDTLI
jgi:hypothetical protein